MKIDGQCHCGELAFEAEVDPAMVSICHCTDCQALSGSAFRINVPAPADRFKMLRGTPKTYVRTAESGARRSQAFCATCGSQIFACAPENPQTYSLRVGTIIQRAALRPNMQIWRRSALPWVDGIADVPAHEKGWSRRPNHAPDLAKQKLFVLAPPLIFLELSSASRRIGTNLGSPAPTFVADHYSPIPALSCR